jgi:Leucine-rich repeat (LRR) protein
LVKLEILNLSQTKVSDLSPLTGLQNLRSLKLRDTQVSDLNPLADLKKLQYVFLLKSELSKEQIDQMELKNRRVRLLCPY